MRTEQRQRTRTFSAKFIKEHDEALLKHYEKVRAGKVKTYKSAKKMIEDITGVKL